MSHDYEIRLEEICTRRKHGFEYFSPYFAILEKIVMKASIQLVSCSKLTEETLD